MYKYIILFTACTVIFSSCFYPTSPSWCKITSSECHIYTIKKWSDLYLDSCSVSAGDYLWCKSEFIKKVDKESFLILDKYGGVNNYPIYAKDKDNVFFMEKPLENADPANFIIIDESNGMMGKDNKNNYYYKWTRLNIWSWVQDIIVQKKLSPEWYYEWLYIYGVRSNGSKLYLGDVDAIYKNSIKHP